MGLCLNKCSCKWVNISNSIIYGYNNIDNIDEHKYSINSADCQSFGKYFNENEFLDSTTTHGNKNKCDKYDLTQLLF